MLKIGGKASIVSLLFILRIYWGKVWGLWLYHLEFSPFTVNLLPTTWFPGSVRLFNMVCKPCIWLLISTSNWVFSLCFKKLIIEQPLATMMTFYNQGKSNKTSVSSFNRVPCLFYSFTNFLNVFKMYLFFYKVFQRLKMKHLPESEMLTHI